MDRYTKGFVVASLFYFLAAALLGIWQGVAEGPEWVGFAHVHLNLLGFMAMMIYGVGYFILPRFNAREIRWPALVPIHFYIANAGLIGMVVFAADRPSAQFVLFSLLSVTSVFLFAVNMGVTLLSATPVFEDEVDGEPVGPLIMPDTRVGEILERWPELTDILINNGFTPLKDPAHQEKVKGLPVTLEMACRRHELDLQLLLDLLNKGAASVEKKKGSGSPQPDVQPLSGIGSATEELKQGDRIGANHIIGDILKVYPATDKIFRKYYGAACFSCPGQATESITQSAMMHNVDVKNILVELNQAAGFDGP